MRIYSTERGFSLTELLVVIAIIAIMSGFVSMSKDLICREQVASATRELLADLHTARLSAMTQGPNDAVANLKGTGINFSSPASYTVFSFNDMNGDWQYDGAGEDGTAKTRSMPSSVEVTSNKDILIFDRMGYPRTDKWGSGWLTVIIRHKITGHARCIAVHTNRIREGIWEGGKCSLR